jgi:hypothetical protein
MVRLAGPVCTLPATTSSDNPAEVQRDQQGHQVTEVTLASSPLAKLPIQRGLPYLQLCGDSGYAHAIGFEL